MGKSETADDQFTIQYGIKQPVVNNITDYALFLGGTNVTHEVLKCYDPLRTGYGRIFMVKKPTFLDSQIPNKLNNFKHILEYANTAIQGIGDITVNFDPITGGYAGNSFDIPTGISNGTNTVTITVYEFSGSPVREVLDSWINGTIDKLTGLSHYNGIDSDELPRLMANQTAEFIYVSTDVTGEKVEYACLLANAYPENINLDAFNFTAGQHQLVEVAILSIALSMSQFRSIRLLQHFLISSSSLVTHLTSIVDIVAQILILDIQQDLDTMLRLVSLILLLLDRIQIHQLLIQTIKIYEYRLENSSLYFYFAQNL